MTPENEDISDVLYLMSRSNFHNWFSKKEIERYVIPALQANQYLMVRDKQQLPIFYASWGFPNYNQVSEYVQTLEFMPEGFVGGGDVPWLIDFIAEGGKSNVAMGFRKVKNVLSSKGYNQFFGLRVETQRLGFHQWGNNNGQCNKNI